MDAGLADFRRLRLPAAPRQPEIIVDFRPDLGVFGGQRYGGASGGLTVCLFLSKQPLLVKAALLLWPVSFWFLHVHVSLLVLYSFRLADVVHSTLPFCGRATFNFGERHDV